ncbi:alpha/beta hydrolase [Paenibacillus sp. YN15]|uniref:alpha/beta hydrolase n=1 Tax=Paenibacillus sp. YN15 TaxID=1742774 RepID=UPI000DCDC105|nr:alpha/beta hydrolase-fold protein [Paenibacillus sp. YN15]RAU92707.1 alpha/beta hydrolase [Paenibacillus sp. YN15]
MLMKGSLIKDQLEDREITIYLPPSCGACNLRLPLLVVQDGDYLFASNTEFLESSFAQGRLPEMIIAGVKPFNRLDEYTPWPAPALVPERPDFGGGGPEYIRFLTERLLPYLMSNYYADGSREMTGIIGASLGGLLSYYAGAIRPDVFGKVGMLSASLWYRGIMDFIRQDAPSAAARNQRMYMSVGTREGEGKETAQKEMPALNREAYGLLAQSGIGPDRLRLDVEEGAFHEHSSFVRRFPEAMEWLFGQPAGFVEEAALNCKEA